MGRVIDGYVRIDYGNGLHRWFSEEQITHLLLGLPESVPESEIEATVREMTRAWAESGGPIHTPVLAESWPREGSGDAFARVNGVLSAPSHLEAEK